MQHDLPGVQAIDILVVDDTPANLRLLAELFGKQGYKVRPAISAAQALAAIETHLPDLFLLDVRMSGMDGYALCEHLKRDPRTRDIPVVFISALGEPLDKVRAFAAGGADYITKPFQFEEVLARIETQLRVRSLHVQLQQQNYQLQQDNAARRALAERLERRNALLKAQHEAAIDGILVVDEQRRISYYNQKYLELWNIPAAAADGGDSDTLLRYMLPQLRNPKAMLTKLEYFRAHADAVSRDEINLLDGRIIDGHTAPIIAPNGQFHGRVWHFRDITHRRQIEIELQRAYDHVKLLNDRLQDELVLARDVQQRLLAPGHPDWPALELVCYTHPAHEVGGDFYDYHASEQSGKYCLALGDVSGKGMPAALLMAVSLAAFQMSVMQSHSPAELLAHLDATIVRYTRTSQQNCALVYLEVDPRNNRVSVVNAGGVAPLIRCGDGTIDWVAASGLPLGVGDKARTAYRPAMLQLAAGDMLIVISDGVLEARDAVGAMFGFERFEQAVRTAPAGSAQATLEHLQRTLMDFVRDTELHDDMTIMVVRL